MVSIMYEVRKEDSPRAEVPAGFALMIAIASATWALDGTNGSGDNCAFGGMILSEVAQTTANVHGGQGRACVGRLLKR